MYLPEKNSNSLLFTRKYFILSSSSQKICGVDTKKMPAEQNVSRNSDGKINRHDVTHLDLYEKENCIYYTYLYKAHFSMKLKRKSWLNFNKNFVIKKKKPSFRCKRKRRDWYFVHVVSLVNRIILWNFSTQ